MRTLSIEGSASSRRAIANSPVGVFSRFSARCGVPRGPMNEFARPKTAIPGKIRLAPTNRHHGESPARPFELEGVAEAADGSDEEEREAGTDREQPEEAKVGRVRREMAGDQVEGERIDEGGEEHQGQPKEVGARARRRCPHEDEWQRAEPGKLGAPTVNVAGHVGEPAPLGRGEAHPRPHRIATAPPRRGAEARPARRALRSGRAAAPRRRRGRRRGKRAATG